MIFEETPVSVCWGVLTTNASMGMRGPGQTTHIGVRVGGLVGVQG